LNYGQADQRGNKKTEGIEGEIDEGQENNLQR
jgi:hypothetical protein